MSGLNYANEKFLGIPVSEDGISFGSMSASGINVYLAIGNNIFSGSYNFETVTVTLKGIVTPPLVRPTPGNIGGTTFSFRNRTWTLLDVTEGAKFNIGGTSKYYSWTCIGVDTQNPLIKV